MMLCQGCLRPTDSLPDGSQQRRTVGIWRAVLQHGCSHPMIPVLCQVLRVPQRWAGHRWHCFGDETVIPDALDQEAMSRERPADTWPGGQGLVPGAHQEPGQAGCLPSGRSTHSDSQGHSSGAWHRSGSGMCLLLESRTAPRGISSPSPHYR